MEKSKEIYLFHQGTYYHAYNLLGCHPENGGAWFRCWAPNAKEISVVGDFNGWDASKNKMKKILALAVFVLFAFSLITINMKSSQLTERHFIKQTLMLSIMKQTVQPLQRFMI